MELSEKMQGRYICFCISKGWYTGVTGLSKNSSFEDVVHKLEVGPLSYQYLCPTQGQHE